MKPRFQQPQGGGRRSRITNAVAKGTRPGGKTTKHPQGAASFSGEVNWVEIDLGDDAKDADHYIKPEERLRLVMALQ